MNNLGELDIVPVRSPVIACGGTHGQFYDLMELFAIGGLIPDSSYQDRITLLRGNHQARQTSQVYGSYDECMKKYGSCAVWKAFNDLFDYLPFASVINDQIFCVHGGLSPNADTLNNIRNIDKLKQIPHQGIMTDILWSDPQESKPGWVLLPKSSGLYFGADVSKKFNHINNFQMIARAHQLIMTGYEIMHDENLVSIFSAPNYCYRCGNLAAFMDLDEHLEKSYTQFDPSPQTRIQNQSQGPRFPDYFL